MKWIKVITNDKPLKLGLPGDRVLLIGFGLTLAMLIVQFLHIIEVI